MVLACCEIISVKKVKVFLPVIVRLVFRFASVVTNYFTGTFFSKLFILTPGIIS
jgi:hypothetical protein